jgi:CRISPR type III-A-associated RAMP protein Csm4
MHPALVVKLRAAGPWRTGSDAGARNRADSVYHSDSLYSAVTAAMLRMGMLEEWLDATARNPEGPAVRFSSCFPFQDEIAFVIPPSTIWPPQSPATPAGRVRWKSARFVPLSVVAALVAGQPLDEEHWEVDGASECLLPAGQPVGPFRAAVRWNAAVDRLSGASERHGTACLEFRPGAGFWAVAGFADEAQRERWSAPVRGAFRWLADSGLGGERSRGWGRAGEPEFAEGRLPEIILPREAWRPKQEDPALETEPGPLPPDPPPPSPAGGTHWLLSLYTPSAADTVDWTRGNYAVMTRAGRIESPSAYGELKKHLHMIAEGSVLVAGQPLRGAAPNVAPEGFPHPVYRAGFALSIPIPGQVTP